MSELSAIIVVLFLLISWHLFLIKGIIWGFFEEDESFIGCICVFLLILTWLLIWNIV